MIADKISAFMAPEAAAIRAAPQLAERQPPPGLSGQWPPLCAARQWSLRPESQAPERSLNADTVHHPEDQQPVP